MHYFILGILPYLTVILFLLGMGYRFYVWARTPQPGALTLFPAPSPGSGTLFSVIREAFLFPGLFKGDKVLWVFAWIFHLMLAFIFVGHVRVFVDFPWLWSALGINADTMSAVSGGIAGVVVMLFALLLVVRRATVRRVREISSFSDFFALILILAILLTGNAMRFGEHFDLQMTRTYFSNLFTFSATASTMPQSGMFMLHFLFAQLLIMVVPFSKIMHFGGIFFTQTVIQRS